MTRPRPRRIDRLLAPLAAALALAGAAPRATADEPPEPVVPKRVAVFAVGVENYSDPALQAENYRKNVRAIAEDAYAVFAALRAAAGDQRFAKQAPDGPSRYLLADRERHPGLALPNASELKKEVTRADLAAGLADFLGQLQDGDLAVVYLGGHGLAAPGTDSLYFLPSDYRTGKLPTAYAMETLLKDINDSLAEKKDVRVLVLANMCHAGAIDPERLPEILGKGRPKTGARIVYVPACAGDVKTFEVQDPPFNGRSVLARHLLRALQGDAADRYGAITSKSLLDYLRKNVPGLPEVQGFEGAPVLLTRISGKESELRGLLADALIACAWDLDGDERRLLLALADWHLHRRRSIASKPAVQFEASLRRLQVRLLSGVGDKRTFDLAAEVVSTAKAAPPGPYAAAARKIQEAVDEARPDKARAQALLAGGYVDYLYAHDSAQFRAERKKEAEQFLNEHAGRWARLLAPTPAARSVTTLLPLEYIAVDTDDSGLPPDPPAVVAKRKNLLASLGQKVEELKKGAGPSPGELFFVSLGSGTLLLESEAPGKYRSLFWDALRKWPGKITVVWAASGGDFLEGGIPEELRDRVSVLAAVGNAKAAPWAVYRLLGDFEGAFEKGLSASWESDLAEVYKKRWAEIVKREPYLATDGEAPPRPRWFGNKKELPALVGLVGKLQTAAVAAPLPTQEWAYDLAFGPGGRVFGSWPPYPPRQAHASAECMTRPWQDELRDLQAELAKSAGRGAPWGRLRAAALSEALQDFEGAALNYGEFSQELTKLLAAAPAPKVTQEPAKLPPGALPGAPAEASRQLLERLLTKVKARQEEAEQGKKSPPALHLVLVPAGDYSSPLLPRLRGPRADAAAWRRAFESLFQGPNKSRLTVTESKPGAARQDILDDVDKAIAGTGKDDVIVFVFSGRGYQVAGRGYRYLVPAGIEPRPTGPFPSGPASPYQRAALGRLLLTSRASLEQMIEVGELTRRCASARDGGRSFIGIFDCQFSAPQAGLTPWPLDKHLIASFPLPSNPAAARAEAARGGRAGRPNEAVPDPAHHVIVVGARDPAAHPPLLLWWSGPLQDALDMADPAQAASPFSRALLQALAERKGKGSYEDWACRAGKALAPTGTGPGRPNGRFVLQGPVERPILLPSVPNDTLRLLLRGYYRRRHNLDLAVHLLSAHDAVLREPADELTKAALLVQRARYLAEVQPDVGPHDAKSDWDEARELLARVRAPTLLGGTGGDEPALADPFAYYLTEALKTAPDPGAALRRLRGLANDNEGLRTEFVAHLLVNLTRSSIERTSNGTVQQSIDLLKRFGRRPPGLEEDLKQLFLPESAQADLQPVDYTSRP